MIDYSKELVSALTTVLPTQHELALTNKTKTPCISYQERNNSVRYNGDTIGISDVSYTVKVWGNRIADLEKYALQIDNVLRPLGFRRTSVGELFDPNSTMIQKILTYEGIGAEQF